jgi:hypothetical protein
VVTWWKEPRYFLPIEVILIVIAGVGTGLLVQQCPPGRRAAGVALAGVAVAAVTVLSVGSAADEHSFWVDQGNRWDLDQRAIAGYLDSADPGGEATVFAWNDDFSRPLSFRLDGAGTVYERVRELESRQRDRFDAAGLSRVSPGSYVAIVPSEQWWATATAPGPHWRLAFEAPGRTALYEVVEPGADDVPVRGELHPAPTAGGASLVALSISGKPLIGSRHTAIGLELDRAAASPASFRLALLCDGGTALGEPLVVEIPTGVGILRRDAFLAPPADFAGGECALAADDGGRWVAGPTVDVGALTTAEAEMVAAQADGWAPVVTVAMSGSRGAVTVAPSAVIHLSPSVPWAGEYTVSVRLHDYGTGRGLITARSGATSVSAPWGGGGVPGLVEATMKLRLAPGATVEVTFERGTQDAAFVDAIAVLGLP